MTLHVNNPHCTGFFSLRSAVIAVGLGSFVLARNTVVSNRKALLDMKRRIRDQAKNEAEIEMERKEEERELRLAAKIT